MDSIYVVGFNETRNWKKEITKYVLQHFWLAIVDEMLEVKVGTNVLNTENIKKELYDYFPEDDFSNKYRDNK